MIANSIEETFPDIEIVTTHYGDNPDTPTGAFELFYNENQIWSKLVSGKAPTATQVLTAIANLRN